jgi:hypothetical protein
MDDSFMYGLGYVLGLTLRIIVITVIVFIIWRVLSNIRK